MNASIERARLGDREAVSDLLESLRPRMTKMAAYYGRCAGEDPDDLLQEAWFGMLEALPNIDVRIGCPRQHLLKRARWRLLDSIRRARVRRCIPLEDAGLPDSVDPATEDISSEVMVSEFSARLKPVQANVLRCLLAGMTWREAGAQLGCTSANVAYHVRQIQRQYAVWCGDEPVIGLRREPAGRG